MNTVDGTVQMSLAAVDKLRTDLQAASAERDELKKELTAVQGDKRVIERFKMPDENSYTVAFDHDRYRQLQEMENFRYRSGNTLGSGPQRSSQELMAACIRVYPVVPYENLEPRFINFEDAKLELRGILEKEISKQYDEELGSLRAQVKTHNQKVSELIEEHTATQVSLQKKLLAEKAALQDKFDKLQQDYKNLEAGKKEESLIETLTQKLREAESEITRLSLQNSKNWFQRFFS